MPAAFWMLHRGGKRIVVVALALLPALAWQLYPVGSAAARAAGDPSVNPAYYSGLLSFLATQNPADGRLEIPFTREHWESARVAPYFPIARGWERQTDLQYDKVLYSPLTASSYRSWLASAGVDLVALPDAPIDYGGKAEQALLAHPPAYLHLVWSDAHWKGVAGRRGAAARLRAGVAGEARHLLVRAAVPGGRRRDRAAAAVLAVVGDRRVRLRHGSRYRRLRPREGDRARAW